MFQKKNPIFVGHFYKRDLRTEEFYSIGRTMCANTHDYVYVRVYPYTYIYIYIYMYIYTHTHDCCEDLVCRHCILHTPDTPLVSCEQVPCKSRALVAKIGLLCTRDMKFKGPNP